MEQHDKHRFVYGLDMGKATISVASARLNPDGTLSDITARFKRHHGTPMQSFEEFYASIDHASIAAIAATGVFADLLKHPILSEVPEETAQEIATRKLVYRGSPVNIVRLGARGYSILTVDANGNVRYEENDKCSSGTGEMVERIAARFGLDLHEAIKLASRASESIPISARCSVFAKSELTHFANQGEPHENLLLGYFESVARNLYSLFEKFKVDGPVVLIGNGAAMEPIRHAFAKMCSPREVSLSPEAGVFDAVGAMHLAAEKAGNGVVWPDDPQALVREKEKRIERLAPATGFAGKVKYLVEPTAKIPDRSPVVMGIDLGSTGSKAALVDVETGVVVADLYRRTEGNPVEAAKVLAAGLAEMTAHPIVAFGFTGSGRYAAATVFKAAYPELNERIFVETEIVAHAEAAIRYDSQKGESLSIVEIGGQDAKFINIQGGRVLESDMNRACSAGTGSFLEEQSIFYGVEDISRFGPMAESSKNPPNLGQMCTVFVAELASEALLEGFSLDDVFAGFQYSVIFNYKNRVMGNRQFMDRVFFQGKPASNPSLAHTLAAVTNREVVVPPNPGAMGAIGIAMLAAHKLQGLKDAQPVDVSALAHAAISAKKTFRCMDSKCKNMCRIESTTVTVGSESRKVVSGGRCPKYEEVSAEKNRLPKDAPNPYGERAELLESLLEFDTMPADAPVVNLPAGHYIMEQLPFFKTFLNMAGVDVVIAHSNKTTFGVGNARCSAPNTCTPVKLMHGLADASGKYLFMPKIVDMPADVKGAGTSTCPMTQAAPEMIEQSLKADGHDTTVIRPIFHFNEKGFESRKFKKELEAFFAKLLVDIPSLAARNPSYRAAYKEALRRQRAYDAGLLAIGKRALEYAKREGYPVALVVGNTHVIHEPIMNGGIHDILSANGAMAVPMDCFPTPKNIPPLKRVYWHTSGRALRASIAAARDGGIFPVLIVSYGCGPASFLEHLFNDLMEDYPHTTLESDGHGGQAGYVTRVQAFLHSVRSYKKGDKPAVADDRIARYDTFPEHKPKSLKDARIVVMTVGPKLGKHIAVSMQARGYDAHFSGLTSAEAFRKGRENCSGKECLPYQLILGSFVKHLEENPPTPEKKTLLLNVTGFGPCRNGMFTVANEIALRKLGLADKVEMVTYGNFKHDPAVFGGVWYSTVYTDILNQLRYNYRAVEKNKGDSDALFNAYLDKLEAHLMTMKTGKGLLALIRNVEPVAELTRSACRDFAKIPIDAVLDAEAPRVLLGGDIYLRIDEYGSDELARKLNEHGLKVVLEPFSEIFEYMAKYRSKELVELEDRWLGNKIMRFAQDRVTHALYDAAREIAPFIECDPIDDIDGESKELLDGTPFSEAILTIGSALLNWRKKRVDGAVIVSPWGCGPALISEAQIRRKPDLPQLYIYNDGDPIDEARISGFAWRLKRAKARAAVTA